MFGHEFSEAQEELISILISSSCATHSPSFTFPKLQHPETITWAKLQMFQVLRDSQRPSFPTRSVKYPLLPPSQEKASRVTSRDCCLPSMGFE